MTFFYKIALILTVICLCYVIANNFQKQNSMTMDNEICVRLETTMGNITVKLYNETPKHRDNFIKLVKEQAYDNTSFHRVIKNFMIQGGDIQNKKLNYPTDYTIPAEFNPALFHKKGALAAARLGDNINPEKASSSCQFYIVTGNVFTTSQLTDMGKQINQVRLDSALQQVTRRHLKEILSLRKSNDKEGLSALQNTIYAEARKEVAQQAPFSFTPEQIQAYTTIGGAPHLDGAYTVFGEVIEGMEVVEQIEKVETDKNDRPGKEVCIIKASIVPEN